MYLNIQLFGGRGAYSKKFKLNTHRTGLDLEKKKFEIHENYPSFPDPNYSNYKLECNDIKLKEIYSIVNYDRKKFQKTAKKYLESLNINKDVKLTTINTGAYGYIEYYVDENNIVHVKKYNLNKADTRKMEYKVKTMIHEGYHAMKDGRKYNKCDKPEQTKLIEETRTEMAAMYVAHKMNGFDYVPSYPSKIVNTFKKYIKMPEYKNCKTIYDLGEKFYIERKNNCEPNYKDLFNKINKLEKDQYEKEKKYIEKNPDDCYNAVENTLYNWQFYDDKFMREYKKKFDRIINKIVKKDKILKNDIDLYYQLIAYAMTKEETSNG